MLEMYCMSSSWKRRLQNVDGKNDGINLPCSWKMEARLLFFGAANYAGLTKKRHAFCFHTDYVFQSLWHSYSSVLTSITSSPLMQTHEVTDQNPDFMCSSEKIRLLPFQLIWNTNFGLRYFGKMKIFATKMQIKSKQQNFNAGQLNTNKIKQIFTTMWMRYICYMYVLIAIFT